MVVYGLWHGGYSYAPGSIEEDLEVFPSVSAASRALMERAQSNGVRRCFFPYLMRTLENHFCPVVEGSEMTVYLSDPREARDPYPDYLLSIGPRGGLRKERC